MRLLTSAHTSTNLEHAAGPPPQHFALINLAPESVCTDLACLRDLAAFVTEAMPSFGLTPRDGWFNFIVYEVAEETVQIVNDSDSPSLMARLNDAGTDGFAVVGGEGDCSAPSEYEILRHRGSTKLMAALDGFWFECEEGSGVGRTTTALVPWEVLETRANETLATAALPCGTMAAGLLPPLSAVGTGRSDNPDRLLERSVRIKNLQVLRAWDVLNGFDAYIEPAYR